MSGDKSDRSPGESSASWDAAADWWKDRSDAGDPYREFVHGPALLRACGDVKGLNILDVGCGSGYFSRVLARAGANVQAIDYSGSLVELAANEEERDQLGIEYRQLDAALVGEGFGEQRFDLVTGCMSIADIEELDTALGGIFKVLKSGGRFCFSLPHPFASPPENRWNQELDNWAGGRMFTRYYGRRRVASGLNRISGKPDGPEIRLWHMPVSDWQDLLIDSGFLVDRVIEPRPTPDQVEEHPQFERIAEIPEFMVIAASRT